MRLLTKLSMNNQKRNYFFVQYDYYIQTKRYMYPVDVGLEQGSSTSTRYGSHGYPCTSKYKTLVGPKMRCHSCSILNLGRNFSDGQVGL